MSKRWLKNNTESKTGQVQSVHTHSPADPANTPSLLISTPRPRAHGRIVAPPQRRVAAWPGRIVAWVGRIAAHTRAPMNCAARRAPRPCEPYHKHPVPCRGRSGRVVAWVAIQGLPHALAHVTIHLGVLRYNPQPNLATLVTIQKFVS